jgi:hypothetical protein
MNYFDILPNEIVSLIYEFDGTHKENFNKVINQINNLLKFDFSRGISYYSGDGYFIKSYMIGVFEDGLHVIEYRKQFDEYPDYFTDDEED